MKRKKKGETSVSQEYPEIWRKFPNASYEWDDERNCWRFKRNRLVCILKDKCHNSFDLNELFRAFDRGEFSLEELMQFYQDIGYTLCGFMELFGREL